MKFLSVVVPAYREADTIAEALTRLAATLDSVEMPYEVIVVSDGNTDGTAERARELDLPGFRVIHYEPNQGKGYAIRTGVSEARGDLIAFIDADLDIHPEGIARFITIIDRRGVDAVVASKTHPDSRVEYPRFRRFQSRVFRALVDLLFDLGVTDTQTGLKVFRREVLETCLPLVTTTGFAFDLELLVLANDAGYAVTEGPVELDFQFSSTTGAAAIGDVLSDIARLWWLRRRGRSEGRWVVKSDHTHHNDGTKPSQNS